MPAERAREVLETVFNSAAGLTEVSVPRHATVGRVMFDSMEAAEKALAALDSGKLHAADTCDTTKLEAELAWR